MASSRQEVREAQVMRNSVGMKRVGGFERGRTWSLSGDGDDGQLDGGPFTEVGGMERRAEHT